MSKNLRAANPQSNMVIAKRGGGASVPPPPVPLPEPRLLGGSLADALRRRRTTREISSRKIGPQTLSNLLFAACGVNRAEGPFGARGITAASASNSQEVDVYVALEQGTYRFDNERHQLSPVLAQDIRRLALGARQPQVSPLAPVQLIYVADLGKLEHTRGFEEPGLHDPEIQKAYYYVDTGIIAANVYLFAAAQRLACWFHNCDKAGLAKRLPLRPEQRVLFAQTVGFLASGPGRPAGRRNTAKPKASRRRAAT